MAKKIESKFLVIEATGEEFMSIGFGCGQVQDLGVVNGGVFDGFSVINVEPGGMMCCDNCNTGILPADTCYYVAVLNQVMCKDCFESWHKYAKYYPEDVPFEKRNYDRVAGKLDIARIGMTV